MKTILLFSLLFLVPWSGNGMGFPHLSSQPEPCPSPFAGKVCQPLPLAEEGTFGNDNVSGSILFLGHQLSASGLRRLRVPVLQERVKGLLFLLWNWIRGDQAPDGRKTGTVPRQPVPAGLLAFGKSFFLALRQATVPKPSLEAVVYTLPQNPFLVYVRLDNPQRRMVLIRVYTDKKEKLYADWTRNLKYNVKLNLSELPNGKYRIEIKGGQKVVEKDLHITTLYEQKTQRILSLAESKATREQ